MTHRRHRAICERLKRLRLAIGDGAMNTFLVIALAVTGTLAIFFLGEVFILAIVVALTVFYAALFLFAPPARSRRGVGPITMESGAAAACTRAARFGVSPTTPRSCASPVPTRSPTTTNPVPMPIRT